MRSACTPASAPWNFTAMIFSLRTSSTPKRRHQRQHRNQRDDSGGQSRLAELRINSESENCRAMNEMPAVPWVSTQAGPTTSTAFLKAVYLSCPAISRSRARECQLHRIGEN